MSLIQKPEPLVIAGKAHYTLTSYDPVEIEVTVPAVCDEEIELALENLVSSKGETLDRLTDTDWVKDNFPGAKNVDDMRSELRSSLTAMNSQMAEEQKEQKCLDVITERLGQSVPQVFIDQVAAQLEQSLVFEAAQAGMDKDAYLAQMGVSSTSFESMLAEQAKFLAEQNAALDAYVSEKKLKVSDDELPRMVRVPPEKADEFFEEAKSTGQLEALRETALRIKALNSIVAECSCTYKHETLDEAKKRTESLRVLMEARKTDKGSGDKESPDLKLV